MAKKTKTEVSDDLMEIISDTPFKDSAPKSHQEELGVLNMAPDNSRPFMEPQDPKILGVLHMDEGLSETGSKPDYKEITLKFTKGLVGDEFQAKDGNTYREIKIPNKDPNDNRPWQSFVARSNRIHEDQFHKGGMWLKLPAEGHTTVKRDIITGDLPDGKHEWKTETEWMPNKDLKKLLDASRPRESLKEKIAEKQAVVNSTPVKGGIAHGQEKAL